MLRYINVFLYFLFFFFFIIPIHAADIEDIQLVLQDYEISYQEQSHINDEVRIDISSLQTLLQINFPDISFNYQWSSFTEAGQE